MTTTSNLELFGEMPDQLKVIFASLDPAMPKAARIALSRLRPESVELLLMNHVASFGEPDADGVMDVTLFPRTWVMAAMARAWLEVGLS